MTTEVVPVVTVQEVLGGVVLAGVPPVGLDTEEEYFRGRMRKFLRCSAAGEFPAPDLIGMRVYDIYFYLPASTAPNVSVYVVDDNGFEYLVDTVNANSGHFFQTNQGFFVPPTFKVRIKSDKAVAITSVVAEDTLVTGDGVTPTYAIQLASDGQVIPGSVSIAAGSVVFTDPLSDGVLVGAGGGGGSGTVDYATGAVSITLNTPASFSAVNALATYDHGYGRVILAQSRGWGQPVPSQVMSIGHSHRPPPQTRP